jgi:hypothetical protein
MTIAYFDDLTVNNLYNTVNKPYAVANDIDVIKHQLLQAGFKIKNLSNFNENGIYNISVGISGSWSAIGEKSKHVLNFLSPEVIQLVKKGRLKIFLNSQGEGWPMIHDGIDGYSRLHKAIQRENLPRYSVIVGDSNLRFQEDYHKWCCENNQIPLVKHCYFLTGFYYFDNRIPEYPLYLDAINNSESKDFNSLNRVTRPHRIEHLYRLVNSGEYIHGLVSGTMPEDYRYTPIFHNVTLSNFKKTFNEVGPLTIDGEWFNVNPDSSETALFNHDIYKNSLLSVVTESAYYYSGMFITEKVFKAIVAGHPFMVLGQPGILKTLRDMGYKTDFYGIDQSYDDIIDPIDRFYKFHLSLSKWINLDRNSKIQSIKKSKDIIEHNFNFYKTKDYVKESYDRFKKVIF